MGAGFNRQYSQNLGVTEEYDPAADRWTRKADLPTPRSGITAAVVKDRIYVFGGEAPSGALRENEAYPPTSHSLEAPAPMPTGPPRLRSAPGGGPVFGDSGGAH